MSISMSGKVMEHKRANDRTGSVSWVFRDNRSGGGFDLKINREPGIVANQKSKGRHQLSQ